MKKALKFLSLGLVTSLFFALLSFSDKEDVQNGYVPKDGFVPNKETAINVALSILKPIYGESVESQLPFTATLNDDKIWVVEGTPGLEEGGVASIEIQKTDRKILKVSHGK